MRRYIMPKSLQTLLKGFETFREQLYREGHVLMPHLAKYGQSPEVMVIACSDSRLDPALILNAEPGDLFMVRSIASIIPAYSHASTQPSISAALEYGVCYLNVKHIIILGHSDCGGVKALLDPESLHQDEFISKWVGIIDASELIEDDVDTSCQHVIGKSYLNLLTYPWIKERVECNTLSLHSWYLNLADGDLLDVVRKENLVNLLK